MISDQLKASITRTVKGSIAAGLAQVSVALSTQAITVTSTMDLVILAKIVWTSFATGLILGLWKYMSWK